MKKNFRFIVTVLVIASVFCLASSSVAFSDSSIINSKNGQWITGDFHTHTYLTDGSDTESDVVKNAFEKYHLDWMANSEHGGTSQKDPSGNSFPAPVWRWITLGYYSYPVIESLRTDYPNKKLIQGVEWNVPSHEHASVGIVTDEPVAVSNFEYMFDASDKDTNRAAEGLVKNNTTHNSALAGAKWLQDNYPDTSYFLINHPSRKLKYSIADIRDFNNIAPDVCFGFEGLPGHQKESARGGYNNDLGPNSFKARTYGGADYMVAKVGGLWDALLGEGRHFWCFVNSDFHDTTNDFWPGEYSKDYTWINSKIGSGNTPEDYKSLIAGMRSGNSFAVNGDLINALDFNIKDQAKVAYMGSTLAVKKGNNAQITIRFKSPEINNNGDQVKVNHIDLIAGDVTEKVQPGSPDYSKDTNETTKVIARFTEKDWKKIGGYYVINYDLGKVEKDQYFRLRGTNLDLNVENQTDKEGNPLADDLVGVNDASKAYADLWFYSNPIFVSVDK